MDGQDVQILIFLLGERLVMCQFTERLGSTWREAAELWFGAITARSRTKMPSLSRLAQDSARSQRQLALPLLFPNEEHQPMKVFDLTRKALSITLT